jgi:hypothetical protein
MAYRPLKYSSDAVYEMDNSEIDWLVYLVLREFALDSDGFGSLNINGIGQPQGRFVDTKRTQAAGTHPTDGNTTSTVYNLRQNYGIALTPSPVRPVHFEDNAVRVMTNSELNEIVIGRAVEKLLNDGIGSYVLTTSGNIGTYGAGTWTERARIYDTHHSGTVTTYILYRKTNETAPPAQKPLKVRTDGHLQEMTDDDISTLVENLRHYISYNENNLAEYRLLSSAPTVGTWRQTGSSITDTRKQVGDVNYVSNVDYVGSYVSNVDYVGTYVGTRSFTGDYVGTKTRTATFGSSVATYTGEATYTGAYARDITYTGNYVSATNFVGNYVSATNFTALTVLNTSENVETLKLWIKVG